MHMTLLYLDYLIHKIRHEINMTLSNYFVLASETFTSQFVIPHTKMSHATPVFNPMVFDNCLMKIIFYFN